MKKITLLLLFITGITYQHAKAQTNNEVFTGAEANFKRGSSNALLMFRKVPLIFLSSLSSKIYKAL